VFFPIRLPIDLRN
jgi:hypothetical protein